MTRPKLTYVSDPQNTANDDPMSLARRQMQRILGGPIFWIIVSATSIVTAMAGPYFTLDRFTFLERLVYWGTTVTVSAVVMTALSVYGYRASQLSRLHWAAISIIAALIGILPVVGSLYLAEGLATGFTAGWLTLADFPALLLSVAPTLVFVTLVVHAVIHYQDAEQGTGADTQAPPTAPSPTLLQSKLPHHLGHDIISVQAQDHYVEVTTPKGVATVLMRLKDAVKDLEPLGGFQVHRSWWVNPAHVLRSEKGASGRELVLSSGDKIPIGRSFRKALRDEDIAALKL